MISDAHETLYLKVKGKSLPIWIYGNPKKAFIFFVHGYFNSFSEYSGDLPVRYLMKDYCVVAFDLPGFGQSKDFEMDPIDFISEVQKQLLKNKKIVLFGVSYGGLLSLKYSLKYPESVTTLIIAGTPYFYGIFNIYKLSVLFPKYKGKKITLEIFKDFKFLNAENLSRIRNPVLLYYNSADFIANLFMGKKLKKLLPNAKIYISKKQNHSWLLHRIDKNGFLTEIQKFISAST